jgi:hypothetical protein
MKRIIPILALLAGSSLFAQTPPAGTTPPPATRPPPATAPAQPTSPQTPFEPHPVPGPLPNNNPAAASIPTGSVPANTVGLASSNSFMLTNQFALTNGISPNGTIDQNLLSVDQAGNLLLNLQVNVQALVPILQNLTQVTPSSSQSTAAGTGSIVSQRTIGQGPNNSIVGVLGTNRVAMNRETFQLLVAAQNDLQRVLPLLRQINGAQVSTTSGLQPSTFPARVVIITNASQVRVLAPTGR